MMSAFFSFQHTSEKLFYNCIELYWYQINSSWNIKRGGGVQGDPQKKLLSKSLALLGLPVLNMAE